MRSNGTNAVPLPASGSAGIPIVTARAAMAHVSPVFGTSAGYAEQIPHVDDRVPRRRRRTFAGQRTEYRHPLGDVDPRDQSFGIGHMPQRAGEGIGGGNADRLHVTGADGLPSVDVRRSQQYGLGRHGGFKALQDGQHRQPGQHGRQQPPPPVDEPPPLQTGAGPRRAHMKTVHHASMMD